jgi:hypothetical protein
MKTSKTIILSAGAVVLLGGNYVQQAAAEIPLESAVQTVALPAGGFTMSATSTSHDATSNRQRRRALRRDLL